jgi:hypothetical protein
MLDFEGRTHQKNNVFLPFFFGISQNSKQRPVQKPDKLADGFYKLKAISSLVLQREERSQMN